MSDQNNLEIYKQRYDTFRHLDRLRWQMFQIAVGAAALILGLRGSLADLRWGSWVGISLLFICLGYSKLRIGNGIVMNSKVLNEFGEKVGDANIPEATKKGASFKIAYLLIAFGFVSFGAALGSFLYFKRMAEKGSILNAWAIVGASAIGLGLLLRWILGEILKSSQDKETDQKSKALEPRTVLLWTANMLIAVGCVCLGAGIWLGY